MRVKEGSEKLNIQKTKIMAHLVLSLDGKLMGVKMEVVTNFIFLGSKITADSDRSHEIKRRLLLRRKAMISLDSVFKSWDITLPTKFHIVKALVFPVVTYRCESQAINKAECQRIVGFEQWMENLWRIILMQGKKSILESRTFLFRQKYYWLNQEGLFLLASWDRLCLW